METNGMYLIRRNERYYYSRRVPEEYREYDPRDVIRTTLKTDSRKKALTLAMAHNERLEAYWSSLVKSGAKHSIEDYKATVDRARTLGFTYLPNDQLADVTLDKLVERLIHVEKQKFNVHHVEAVLGGKSTPQIKLDEVFSNYCTFNKDKTLNKSPNQIRKWENPRTKAIRNFILCSGNKAVHELGREDALRFRNWWIDRIENENLTSGTARKDFVYIKTMVGSVAENLNINLDVDRIFKNMTIKKDDGKQRLPFDTEYIVKTLLDPDNLKDLNEQAKNVLYAFADTGAGLNELTGLRSEDIELDEKLPFIWIRPRKGHSLKTKFRNRQIPLVGFALEAFKKFPDGFSDYHDRPDSLSGLLSKYLSDHNLLPSDQHTVYSLRHSFQDRLTAVDAPDRVQAELMGHKFNREKYGKGPTLEKKMEWMKEIQLKSSS